MNPFMKQNRITDIQNRLVVAKGEGFGGGKLGLVDASLSL